MATNNIKAIHGFPIVLRWDMDLHYNTPFNASKQPIKDRKNGCVFWVIGIIAGIAGVALPWILYTLLK